MDTVHDVAVWEQCELEMTSSLEAGNPYLGQEIWVRFEHEDGTVIERPAFWDGGKTFRVRFASPKGAGRWRYSARSSPADAAIEGVRGEVRVVPGAAKGLGGQFGWRGFLGLSEKTHRNLVYADGSTFLLVGDTAWALPWRATPGQAKLYAGDRAGKGFNAALLMVIQSDMEVDGPEERHLDEGFARGFDDLPKGTLKQLRPDYFQYLDELIGILVGHGIVPVYQPVFHGYGWKGLKVAGRVVTAEDMARFQRYLIARYGALPAIWLVGGDGDGLFPNVAAAGEMCEAQDAYGHPTGIHYQPHTVPLAHHGEKWLDFQWCQTGHNGEHMPERVMQMRLAQPPKAVANGEPTYENMGAPGRAAGWWQGHEAWMNLTSGGTMGVVYGAGSLWQWRLSPEEPGHAAWCTALNAGWREALRFEGSKYVGMVAKILGGIELDGMSPNWWFLYGGRGLEVPGKLYIVYREDGADVTICDSRCPRHYRIIDPTTGEQVGAGELAADVGPSKACNVALTRGVPRVVIFENR